MTLSSHTHRAFIYFVLGLLSLAAGVLLYVLWPWLNSPLRSLPGPASKSLLLGNLEDMGRLAHENLLNMVNQYGPVFASE